MASEQQPIPIIACGKTTTVGVPVIEGLKPEFDVVAFITTPEACIADIPTILKGEAPANPTSDLGSGDFSRRPVAVIMGGGYREHFDEVRNGVEATFDDKGSGLQWVLHDGTKPAPPFGPEYGKAMMERLRETLGRLAAERKLGSGKTEVQWY